MQVKVHRAGSGNGWVRRVFRRRVVRGLFFVGLLVSVALAGMGYGMLLVKSGRSMSMSDWGKGLAETKLGVVPNVVGGWTTAPPRIEIDLKFKHEQRIAHTRERALEAGRLYATDDDWVPAKIRHEGEELDVRMRLKGDLSDHWRRPDFWSYKVKVKGDGSLFGMRRFALQDPRTRKFLNEWIMHALQRELGLIALRYRFVEVAINGEEQPIYALEENFEKRLIENNDRREGPIVRFDRWFYWRNDPGLTPELAGASIEAYQEKKYGPEGGLAPLFESARTLLELYRRGELSASRVFDVDRLGTFFALCELAGYDHATRIDNLKFYYNPVTALLEPIGYDFNHIRPLTVDQSLLGARVLPRTAAGHVTEDWTVGLFADDDFLRAYVEGLRRVSDPDFLAGFFEEIEGEMNEALGILHKSYPWYEFRGRPVLEANQDYIRRFLDPERSLQVYLLEEDEAAGRVTLSVSPIHALPVELIALTRGDKRGVRLEPAETTRLHGYATDQALRYEEVVFHAPPGGPRVVEASASSEDTADAAWTLHYRLLGTSRTRSVHVLARAPWNTDVMAGDLLRRTTDLAQLPWLRVDEESQALVILPGRWVVQDTVLLPPGYEVLAGPGVELELQNGANLVSRSPLSWSGTEEEPIRVLSDGSGQGVFVAAGGMKSRLSWVEFSGLDNPEGGGWQLTGAVTFYETPVEIASCSFVDAQCEDGLNVVRSNFLIRDSLFLRTFSDAFDGDFCTGRVENTVVRECGNDGIDFSGSVVELSGVRVVTAGDKGISVGERSRTEATDVVVRGANIGLASKDDSHFVIDGAELTDVRYGLAAYQKKPEFGPSRIHITGLELEDVGEVYLIEAGSELAWEDGEVVTYPGDVLELLYGDETP